MASTLATDWGKTFNPAAVAFSKDINGLMKTDPGASRVLKQVLQGAQSPMGILGALATMDKIDLGSGNDKQRAALPANGKLFKAAFATLTTEKTKYVKEVDEALNTKITLKDKNGYNLPTAMKDAFPDTYRNLKVLRAEAEAMHARAANMLSGAENAFKNIKIDDAKNAAKSKVEGDSPAAQAKVDAITEEAAMKKYILAFATSFKSSMAKGATAIQKIKASPTVAVYNQEMANGGRDISQNLVNIGKLKTNPQFAKSSLAKKLPDPGALAAQITPFGNGNLRALAPTTSPQDVKRALDQFSDLHKRIAATYANVLAGKV